MFFVELRSGLFAACTDVFEEFGHARGEGGGLVEEVIWEVEGVYGREDWVCVREGGLQGGFRRWGI